MSRIVPSKVVCACCGKNVVVDRVFSFSSNQVGLSGNKHTPIQYRMEECPECHYVSLDIEDKSIKVSREMVNSFHVKPDYECIQDPSFISILKAADIYERNNDNLQCSYVLRLASFFAEEMGEKIISKRLLKQSNEGLELYFEAVDELTVSDLYLAIALIDGNRRLGMTLNAGNMCDDLLDLVDNANFDEADNICRILKFEKSLLEKRDIKEHLMSEVI